MRPDLDHWLADAVVAVTHRRASSTNPATLWAAAQGVRVGETPTLGRLVRLRIPGITAELRYDEMFRSPPFNVLEEGDGLLISGLVGRIWTLKRDYPELPDPEAFRAWHTRGTVRVMFASWIESTDTGAVLINETRVDAVDRRARAGLAALGPLITRAHGLIGSEGLEVAVARAERTPGSGA